MIQPTSCFECHTKITPLFRYGPRGIKDLCNACGIRWKRSKDKNRTLVTGMKPKPGQRKKNIVRAPLDLTVDKLREPTKATNIALPETTPQSTPPKLTEQRIQLDGHPKIVNTNLPEQTEITVQTAARTLTTFRQTSSDMRIETIRDESTHIQCDIRSVYALTVSETLAPYLLSYMKYKKSV